MYLDLVVGWLLCYAILSFACHFPFLFLCSFSFTAVPGSGATSTPNNLGLGTGSSSAQAPPSHLNTPPTIQVTASTPIADKKQARVLYDYDAADTSEISLLADEVLQADWLKA